ncbi:MAG: ABC transporter substrate-binding protein [Pseudomonadota bacterium]
MLARDIPQRIVSLNTCTDQLVLALADPDQIVGLSRFAGDERLSHAADKAQPYPHLPADAEAVLALEPDLVFAGRFTDGATKQMLRRLGLEVIEVPFVRTLEEAQAVIIDVGRAVGRPARSEALIADIDGAFAAAGSQGELTALILQRRGYATGTASLTGDILRRLGIRLASDELVGARGGFADLETVVRADPDILILAQLDSVAEDQGSALLRHPALAERYPSSARMALPERLTLCAGPSLIDAADYIARERDAFLTRLRETGPPDG